MLISGDATVEHICWDDDQIEHLAQPGVSVEEFEQAYWNWIEQATSRSSRRPARVGFTIAGRKLFVVYESEMVDDVAYITPVTAYEID